MYSWCLEKCVRILLGCNQSNACLWWLHNCFQTNMSGNAVTHGVAMHKQRGRERERHAHTRSWNHVSHRPAIDEETLRFLKCQHLTLSGKSTPAPSAKNVCGCVTFSLWGRSHISEIKMKNIITAKHTIHYLGRLVRVLTPPEMRRRQSLRIWPVPFPLCVWWEWVVTDIGTQRANQTQTVIR